MTEAAEQVQKRASFGLVAKQEIGKLRAWARVRGWQNLRLLSAHDSSFIRDLGMEDDSFGQRPGASVFRRETDGSVRHTYTVEASLAGCGKTVTRHDELAPTTASHFRIPGSREEIH